jgi:3',5'-cyclic AMP phosphodiesterase CpdA
VSGAPTRRELLRGGAAGALALVLGGCAGSAPVPQAASGSTLESTWGDPRGSGVLERRPGEGLLARTDLAAGARLGPVLATIGHLTDAHVLDAQSPARVPFLDRLGPPFTSTFRPHETLTAQVLDGAVRALRALAPDAVVQGGDLVDNAQANELAVALAVLHGGAVDPGSGPGGYHGVQSASDPDPFYYRPDVDAPRHPGMLAAATSRFPARGLGAGSHPVLGDHDLLVQGLVPPDPLLDAVARGAHAVWELPPDLGALTGGAAGLLGARGESAPESPGALFPAGAPSTGALAAAGAVPDGLPDGPALRELIGELVRLPGVRVPADARRRELGAGELLSALRAAGGGGGGGYLDYHFDVGPRVRVLVLDLARREGGSGGLVHAGQPAWLAAQLSGAGDRWVLVFSHQPLESSSGGGDLLALLDRAPRVLAAICGHTHRNSIRPRSGPGGGYWLIETASLIDYPQQARALRVRATSAGAALETWMLDHVPGDVQGLGDISRELSYLDAQGGRPQGFAGGRLDRNVILYRAG